MSLQIGMKLRFAFISGGRWHQTNPLSSSSRLLSVVPGLLNATQSGPGAAITLTDLHSMPCDCMKRA
jgi:hypothetical protein